MLAPGLESLILRAAVIPSSLVTGTVVGVVAGAAAWAFARLRRT